MPKCVGQRIQYSCFADRGNPRGVLGVGWLDDSCDIAQLAFELHTLWKSTPHREPSDDQVCRHDIRRERNIVDVADPQQCADVRVVRLRTERIDEEEHRINSAFRNARSDLGVTAFGAAEQRLDVETNLVTHQLRRVSGSGERELGQCLAIERRPRDEIHFLAVVRDER